MMSGTPDYWNRLHRRIGDVGNRLQVAADAGDANQTRGCARRSTRLVRITAGSRSRQPWPTRRCWPDLSDIKRLDVVAEVRLNALAGARIKHRDGMHRQRRPAFARPVAARPIPMRR